jgi:hypothetical protein
MEVKQVGQLLDLVQGKLAAQVFEDDRPMAARQWSAA